MTSEEYIEILRNTGVKLKKNDGSLTEIPSDILKQSMEQCVLFKSSSITYDIYDPNDSEHITLRILDCGYAE